LRSQYKYPAIFILYTSNMQKELTIQELENLNFDLYKDKPLDLIPFGKKLVSSHRHEKAIELFEFGLKTIIAQNNNNEFYIDCAKFNYHYADALIAKLFESNELLNNGNLPAEEDRKRLQIKVILTLPLKLENPTTWKLMMKVRKKKILKMMTMTKRYKW